MAMFQRSKTEHGYDWSRVWEGLTAKSGAEQEVDDPISVALNLWLHELRFEI